jgi:hypothetical protein
MKIGVNYEGIMRIIDSIIQGDASYNGGVKSNLAIKLGIFETYSEVRNLRGSGSHLPPAKFFAFSKEGFILMQVYMSNYDTNMPKEEKLEIIRLGLQAYLVDLAKRG